MVRTSKPHEYAAKRTEILNATMALILSKGYERTTIREILDGLGISKGAFYHYFDSKAAVVDAFIDQIRTVTEPALLPIVNDPELAAIDKLQRFFSTFDRLRAGNMSFVVSLGMAWYSDANALVRAKVNRAIREQRAPLLTTIVRQGIGEGVFSCEHPDDSGGIIMSLIQGMAGLHAKLLWQPTSESDDRRRSERIAQSHAAYMDAIERVLGAPAQSLNRVDKKSVLAWLRAVQNRPSAEAASALLGEAR